MKTTNKYPVFKLLSRAEVDTEFGLFEMKVHKEKCGQTFMVEFDQRSYKRNGKEYAFYNTPLIFKLSNGEMKYDPMNVIKSNFTETVEPNSFKIGYNGSILYLKNHIQFAIRHLDESLRGD